MKGVVLALALAWALALIGSVRLHRRGRVPARVAALRGHGDARKRVDPLAELGRGARSILYGGPANGGDIDRWIGAALAAGLCFVALGHPVLGLFGAVAMLGYGWRLRAARSHRRQREVEAAIPDLVDLLSVAVGAGCTAERAVRAVTPHCPAPLASALAASLRRLDRGAVFEDALAPLTVLPGRSAGPVARLLVAAQLDGVALGPALERLGDEARRQQRRLAAEAARRLPVRLLLPLVLCTLPAFALLTVVPVLLATLGRLR